MSVPFRHDWTWRDPSTPEERLDAACWHYVEEAKFRPSLVARARRRVEEGSVTPHWAATNTWIVASDPGLGDHYDDYTVSLANGRYACSCFGHEWGGRRARKLCSHMVAVMLWRRMQGEDTTGVEPGPESPEMDRGPDDSLAPTAPATSSTAEHIGWWSTPAEMGFPQFAAFRPHQKLALKRIVEAFDSGVKVVLVEAPTGTGKSLLGAAAGKILRRPVVYVSTTKQLQDQFLAAFPSSRTLKGRDNYTPLNYLPPEPGCDDPGAHDTAALRPPTCEACDKSDDRCSFCHDVRACPYEVAKREALLADQAVLNTAYLLLEANHVGRFSDYVDGPDGGRIQTKVPGGERLLVLDEADTLESALMGFVSVEIPMSRLEELRVAPPPHKDPKDKEGEWGAWLTDTMIPALKGHITARLSEVGELRQAVEENEGADPSTTVMVTGRVIDLRTARLLYAQARRRLNGSTRLLASLERMQVDLARRPDSWVRTDEGEGRLVFKPVMVAPYAQELLWRHYGKVLVMSATILSADRFCRDMGLRRDEVATVVVPSPFPVRNRLIHYVPVGSMDRRDQEATMPRVLEAVNRILDLYPEERVLIHGVSYDLAQRITAGIAPRHRRRLVTFRREKGAREEALERYKRTPGAVIVGAALDRGVDLPDDLARVVVIPKVPKPSLGDRQVARRLYGFGRDGREWYQAQTIRTLVQATGRGVRHRDDWCATYVLDSSFERLWSEARHLLPNWWREAVRFENAIRRDI